MLRGGAYTWFMVPAALLLGVVYLVPLAQVLLISVTDPALGLENYAQLASPPVIRVLGITARICAATTLVAVGLGYAVAYVLVHAGPRWQRVMLVCVLLPLWVSVLARAFAWVALLRRAGIVNTWLMQAGVIAQPLPLIWNEFGVGVGMVHTMLPFAILPIVSHMRGLDPALLAAARGLGASRGQVFRRVFLPLSLPGLAGAAVLVTILSLGFYVIPVLLGGGRVMMVAEYIALQIQELLRWGVGATLAVTLVTVIAALLGVARLARLRTIGA